MHIRILYNKCYYFCFAQYLGTILDCDNKVIFSAFATLYSCTYDLILEELKNIRWSWHQEIMTPCMCLWHYLYNYVTDTSLIYDAISIYMIYITESESDFVTCLLYFCKTDTNTLNFMSWQKCHDFCTGVYMYMLSSACKSTSNLELSYEHEILKKIRLL